MPEKVVTGVDWTEMRRQMPVTRRWAYFDHAAVSPIPEPTQNAISAWLKQAAEEGDTLWSKWADRLEILRRRAATMIGAETSEIALVSNTTTGISLVAEGFPWSEGDNVITVGGEFPSNLYPWMNLASRGVEERRIEPEGIGADLNSIADSCDARTRIIAISWVGFATGWRIDVDALVDLAHRRKVLVFLDAIQGLGVFPLDVRKTQVDFLAADGHKWMLGPEGAGLLFVRNEHLDLLRPLNVGWQSVVHRHDYSRVEFDIREEAARYEGGSHNMAGFFGLDASLQFLQQFGVSPSTSPIAERVLETNRFAAERLRGLGAKIISSMDSNHASGILSFEFPGCDPVKVRHSCLQHGVALSQRAGRLRISPHAYTNEDDVDQMVKTLRTLQSA